MPDATSTSNRNTLGRAQRRKLKRFERRLFTGFGYHPDGEFYKKGLTQLRASISATEWDRRLAETQSSSERKREENLELISDATSPQAASEVRLLIESRQDPWAYRYPASDSFKASTGCDRVIVTCRDGFLGVLGVPADA